MIGTLRVGDRDMRVVRLELRDGAILVEARVTGPTDLDARRAELRGVDDSLICVIEPFSVSETEIAHARAVSPDGWVTVLQPIRIKEVEVVAKT